MLTLSHIKEIIEQCREIGNSALINGISAIIPCLEIDILQPPRDFLGVQGNPAVFVNKYTYKLLGKEHENWIMNGTIALKSSFLQSATIQVIGAIVHETGHAFNIAAGIVNSEANAYIFEIEVMLKLYQAGSLKLLGCSYDDLQRFFELRMSYYSAATSKNTSLKQLVQNIANEFALEDANQPILEEAASEKLVVSSSKHHSFFKPWIREEQIVMSRISAWSTAHFH